MKILNSCDQAPFLQGFWFLSHFSLLPSCLHS